MNLPTAVKGLFTLTTLFAFVVLVFNLPTLGHNLTPRSLFSWACIAMGITWCGLVVLQRQCFQWHRHFVWLFLPPIGVALFGSMGPPSAFAHYPTMAFFALLLGAAWVLGLVQLQLTAQHFYGLSCLVLTSSAVLSLLTLGSPQFFNFIPQYDALSVLLKGAFGGFQQVNNFSSYLAASIVFGFVTLAQTNATHRLHQVALFLLTLVCSTAVWVCGSRTGYLGLSIAAVLLVVWVAKYKPSQKVNLCIWLVAIGVALFISLKSSSLGVAPQYWVTERLADLPQGGASTARKDMWLVTLSLWRQAPIFGHGLGSFTQIFTPEFERLLASGFALSPRGNALTHPHNELLLWLAETGLVGVSLVILPWLALVGVVLRQKPALGLAWFAALFPIALHTLTEFPLHGSGAHWFLFGLILSMGLSELANTVKPFAWPRYAWLGAAGGYGAFGLILTIFLIHSAFVSHIAFVSFHRPNTINSDYLAKWVNSPEFYHPLLDEYAKDMFILNTATWVLNESDSPELIKQWLPEVESQYKRYASPSAHEQLEKYRASVAEQK
jgi:O-antigen ligase